MIKRKWRKRWYLLVVLLSKHLANVMGFFKSHILFLRYFLQKSTAHHIFFRHQHSVWNCVLQSILCSWSQPSWDQWLYLLERFGSEGCCSLCASSWQWVGTGSVLEALSLVNTRAAGLTGSCGGWATGSGSESVFTPRYCNSTAKAGPSWLVPTWPLSSFLVEKT